MIDFILQHKKIATAIGSIFLFLIIVNLLSPSSTKRQGPNPTITPIPTIREFFNPFQNTSTNPENNTSSISPYENITITLPTSLTEEEQKHVTITTLPAIPGNVEWSEDGKQGTLQPNKPLDTNQQYSITARYLTNTYTWTFTTKPQDQVTTDEYDTYLLNKGDSAFAKDQGKLDSTYPWIQNLPLSRDNYFVYFDISTKKFIGYIYVEKTEPTPTANELKTLKHNIMNDLLQIIPNAESYPIEWTVTSRF